MGYVMDRVCDGVCDGRRLSQAEGVTEVWLFGEDSFKECPLTAMSSTYLIASSVSGLVGKSRRSVLYMMYRSIERGSPCPMLFSSNIGSDM